MSTIKTRGIILKETMVGESDKIVTLLSKEYGKLSVSARGARKTVSKLLAGTQLFTYADYVIFVGNGFYSLTQADPIEIFFGIRNDYERLCYGAYFLELIEKNILENINCDDILFLLLKSLTVLDKGRITPMLVRSIFELKFLQLSGYAPEVYVCSVCGEPTATAGGWFFGSDGFVCRGCRRTGDISVPVSQTSLYTMAYILESESSKAFSFTVTDDISRELNRIIKLLMSIHMELQMKSLKFIDEGI